MNSAIAGFAEAAIQERIGITVRAGFTEGSPDVLEIAPADLHPSDSFSVRFSPGWRTAEVLFVPGKYAAPLIEHMGRESANAGSILAAFAVALDKRKTRLVFRVNGSDLSPLESTEWPKDWKRLELGVRSAPQVINADDVAQMRQLVMDLVVPVFGIVTALIGVEESDPQVDGQPEGTPHQTMITRYERRKVNREACIQLKGWTCATCGFDFSAFYGDLGRGYIEIHHTTPVSELGPDYRINVFSDLVPLCANCHAMVHRQTPPILVAELANLVKRRRTGE